MYMLNGNGGDGGDPDYVHCFQKDFGSDRK